MSDRRFILTASAILLAWVLFAGATPASAAICTYKQWNPVNCRKDFLTPNDAPAGYPTCEDLKGFCMNGVCHCNRTDPGFCHDLLGLPNRAGDLCWRLPYCSWSPTQPFTCGDYTVVGGDGHVDIVNCRCIQGYPGGCNSYCMQDPPACPTLNQKCTSEPNVCGMTNDGTINSSCVCGATKPDDNLCHNPVGYLEANPPFGSITLKQMCTELRGWALDTDYSGSIPVEVWDNGSKILTLTANASRPDVAVPFPGHELSGYSFSTGGFTRGVAHTIQVFGINVDIKGNRTAGPHPQLTGSPLTLTCPRPPRLNVSADLLAPTQGTATTVRWDTVDATSCTGTGGDALWAGSKAVGSGSYLTQPIMGPTTYTITCVNAIDESITQSVTINPQAVPPTVVITGRTASGYCNGTPNAAFTMRYTSMPGFQMKKWRVQLSTTADFSGVIYDYTSGDLVQSHSDARPAPLSSHGVFSRVMSGFRALLTGILPSVFAAQVTAEFSMPNLPTGTVQFDTQYYVRAKAWDSFGTEGTWSAPVAGTTDFRTPKRYPRVVLSMDRTDPAASQSVTFTDDSEYFGNDSALIREWDFFTDGSPEITGNPGDDSVTFMYPEERQGVVATLRIISTVMLPGDSCTDETMPFDVQKALPEYKEVRPGVR